MAAVKFSATEDLNLWKKCGNSSWILRGKRRKSLGLLILKCYNQVSKKKLRTFR
jgi:hypothetical protein